MPFQTPYRGQDHPELQKVSGLIPLDWHKHFERMTLGHGYVTYFIWFFYSKLKEACDAAEIAGAWGLDTEEKVSRLLSNLNFKSKDEIIAEYLAQNPKPKAVRKQKAA